jgi:hypothetical protein
VRTGEFLKKVLPDDGYYIVARPFLPKGAKKSTWYNVVVDDILSLQVKAKEFVSQQFDVFYAMATYAERQVWDPGKRDYKTGKMGAYTKRTQSNVKWMRSFYLDIDIKDDPEEKNYAKHYHTQREGAIALVEFCRAVGLPRPMLISSGRGIHAYWPLTTNVAPADWKPVAERLKSACIHHGLKADHGLTADEARVLRVPGTFNFKRGEKRPVEVKGDAGPYDLAKIADPLATYIAGNNVSVSSTKQVGGLPARAAEDDGVTPNIGATNEPLNGNALVYACPAMAKLVGDRGASATYPQWVAGLNMAKFCDQPKVMMLAVSDGHKDFDATLTAEKMGTLGSKGPTKCNTFWQQDAATCEGCQWWRNKTSPAEVARVYRATPPKAAVEIPAPPKPYMFDKGMVWVVPQKTGDDEEEPEQQIVLPYILYPRRIMEQTTDEDEHDERSVWVAELPRKGQFEFRMPQTILSDPRKLHAFLLGRGLHINPRHAKAAQFYMSAYLNELAKVVDRERMYERLGWHDNYKCFVTPHAVYHRNGEVTHHAPSRELEAVTKNAFHTVGTLDGWLKAISFYNNADPAYRIFFYATYGAPLMHMTTHKGVLIAASGETGRGKTTLLEACGSISGNPDFMLVAGGKYGSTVNALFEILGKLHSSAMFWDDTTERDPEEMREFMLHISTGKGKDRMKGNKHDGRVVTWETMVLSSANTDDVNRVMATGKDSDPHLMRFISVPFDEPKGDTNSKVHADAMKRAIRDNYGHAWPVYMQYVVEHYEEIKAVVEKMQERFDRLLNVTPDERHWTAMMAVSYVGGRIAYNLGLLPFDPRDDKDWMLNHVGVMRLTYQRAASSSLDIFNEFLDTHAMNTLTLQAKGSSNIDNVAHEHRGALLIRNELDTGRMYVARTAIGTYCNEVKANQHKLENELKLQGVILRRNCYKVLGADSKFAQGQVRCWEIDRTVLGKLKGTK